MEKHDSSQPVAAASRGRRDVEVRTRFDPARRGLLMLYHSGEVNRCPGCGRTHWHVGRLSAECAFCGTALALAETGMTGVGLFRVPAEPAFDEAA
jgi:hypothetical protein